MRLRAAGLSGRTVVLKLRTSDFVTITRSRTLADPTDLGRRIYDEVREVYEATGKQHERIRLVGVRVEQLAEGGGGGGLALWDDDDDWREAETTMDAAPGQVRGDDADAGVAAPSAARDGARGARDETTNDPATVGRCRRPGAAASKIGSSEHSRRNRTARG